MTNGSLLLILVLQYKPVTIWCGEIYKPNSLSSFSSIRHDWSAPTLADLIENVELALHIPDLTPIGMAHQFEEQREAYRMWGEDGSVTSICSIGRHIRFDVLFRAWISNFFGVTSWGNWMRHSAQDFWERHHRNGLAAPGLSPTLNRVADDASRSFRVLLLRWVRWSTS